MGLGRLQLNLLSCSHEAVLSGQGCGTRAEEPQRVQKSSPRKTAKPASGEEAVLVDMARKLAEEHGVPVGKALAFLRDTVKPSRQPVVSAYY